MCEIKARATTRKTEMTLMTYLYLNFIQILTELYFTLLPIPNSCLNYVFLFCRIGRFLNPLSSSPGVCTRKVHRTAQALCCSEYCAIQGFIFPTQNIFRQNIPEVIQSNRPRETAEYEIQTSTFYCSAESDQGKKSTR